MSCWMFSSRCSVHRLQVRWVIWRWVWGIMGSLSLPLIPAQVWRSLLFNTRQSMFSQADCCDSITLIPSEVRWSVTELETDCFSYKQWTKVKMRGMLKENDMVWLEKWGWHLGKSHDRYLVPMRSKSKVDLTMVSSSCQCDTVYNLGMEISMGNYLYYISLWGYLENISSDSLGIRQEGQLSANVLAVCASRRPWVQNSGNSTLLKSGCSWRTTGHSASLKQRAPSSARDSASKYKVGVGEWHELTWHAGVRGQVVGIYSLFSSCELCHVRDQAHQWAPLLSHLMRTMGVGGERQRECVRECVCQCASACLCFCVYVWEYVWMCLCVSVCESIVCLCVSICVAERGYVSVSACKTMCQCVCVWEKIYVCASL